MKDNLRGVWGILSVFFIIVAMPWARVQAESQGIPLDDKARYDRFLQEQIESVLLKMLGPNHAKVVVDASLDFSRTERFDITAGANAATADGKSTAFAWENVTAKSANTGPSEFLPGIALDSPGGGVAAIPQSYEHRYAYPTSFVKRLMVTILLNNDVKTEQVDAIRSIVSDFLDLDPKRGDVLSVVRTEFAPAWKTVWYAPESFAMVFRYAILSLMTLIILLVVGRCFLRLAAAMDSMAHTQSQQYSIDVKSRASEALGEELPASLTGPLGEEKKKEEEKAPEEDESMQLRIDVKPEQVPILVQMLRTEDAENVALVAAYLKAPVRKEFMHGLPRALTVEVLSKLSCVQFVELDLVEKIKYEIERCLSGATGGMGTVHELLDSASPLDQQEILREIALKNPELYRALRGKVIFFDDLARLEDREWAQVAGHTHASDWTALLPQAPAWLLQAVRSHVLPKAFSEEILEQAKTLPAPLPQKVEQIHAAILTEVRKLVSDGIIRNPAPLSEGLPAPASTEATAVGEQS